MYRQTYDGYIKQYRRNMRLNDWRRWKLESIKQAGTRRNIDVDLSVDDIEMPTHCPIFGFKLNYDTNIKDDPASPSIDRINNDLGYVRGNIITCSRRANSLKKDATVDEMEKLYRFYAALQGASNG